MSTPKLHLRKSDPHKDGRYPVFIRFRENGRPIRKTLEEAFFPEEWDETTQSYIGENAKAVNLKLQRQLSKANEIRIQYHLRKEPLTQKEFTKAWSNASGARSFIDYMRKGINSQYERGLISKPTKTQKIRTVNRLQNFQNDTRFSDLTVSFFERFDQWHSKDQMARGNLGIRERERAIKHIKEFILKAQRDRLIDNNPLSGFRMPKSIQDIVFLEEGQVRSLIDLYKDDWEILTQMLRVARERNIPEHNIEQFASDSGVQRIKRTIRSFLIQVFTGMRYGDLCKTGPKSVKGKFLVFMPEKTQDSTGQTVYMPVTKILKWVISEFNRGQYFCSVTNQVYNRNLKDVAAIANLHVEITTHVARHTFATLYMSRGGDLRSLMDLLGVRSIKTVMVYAHSSRDICLRKMIEAFDDF